MIAHSRVLQNLTIFLILKLIYMRSLPIALLITIFSFVVSCKKDVAGSFKGSYTGILQEQDLAGALQSETYPTQVTIQAKSRDSIVLTVKAGVTTFFTHNLPVNNNSEFGYTSSSGGSNYSYEGRIKGDSLVYLYVQDQASMPLRYLFKGTRN
jgi:hypothetical protein